MNDLLLDTCAFLWLAQGGELAVSARKAIAAANLKVSLITVWEIANLARKHRIVLTMPVAKWFVQAVELMEAVIIELTVDILAGSCELPGTPPSDPADRIIIATAREARAILVTRDNHILAYSRSGYVTTTAC